MSEDTPTEADAIEIATSYCGAPPSSVRRFTTGIGHWVYDVCGAGGANIVVRLAKAEQKEDFLGAVHWSSTLRPLGVPLPELLATGELRGLPYLVLERLAGDDLGNVYGALSSAERKGIASDVCRIQQLVRTLPEASGYGYLRLPGSPPYSTWHGAVHALLERSRTRIDGACVIGAGPVDRVLERARQFSGYFSRIRPTPFLDDTTTKNVIVHAGRLSGIVDVDWMCFGDPLLTVGLTRTALRCARAKTEYTDHWCELLDLTTEQQRAVRFYTALFCVDFMSDFGQRFNADVMAVDTELLTRLEQILNDELNET